ncbi:hypothetical protein [Haliea sp.]|nr:hypothetical protein [Haliea sp.]
MTSTKHLASTVAGKQVFVEAAKKDRNGCHVGKIWVQPRDCPIMWQDIGC